MVKTKKTDMDRRGSPMKMIFTRAKDLNMLLIVYQNQITLTRFKGSNWIASENFIASCM